MGDVGEMFNALKAYNRALRAKYGINCPQCKVARPKAHPSILLPQQRCKVDGYRDPRPYLTSEQHDSIRSRHDPHRTSRAGRAA